MSMNTMKKRQFRYIAYIRKSEERQERQELSLSSQKQHIRDQFPGITVVKWIEESKSAFKPGRALFDEMISQIEAGQADGIVAWHPNRLARNEIDSSKVTYLLRTKLKDLKFCSYNFDNSPEGVMMLQFTMNQGQYESAKQAKDVRRGMQTKAAGGERPGMVPQGYMKVPITDSYGSPIKDPKSKKYITVTGKDPERFDMVQRMWKMLLSGSYTASQIRKIARDEWQYTTRRTNKTGGVLINHSLIYKIFNNIYYAGWISHEGKLSKGNHPTMISLEEFDYAQKLLGQKGKPRQGAFEYAYTSLIKCGECGCSVVGKTQVKFNKATGKTKLYVYYHCTRKSEVRLCTQTRYTPLATLEKDIDEELSKYTILPEFRDLALKILERNNKVEVRERTQVYSSQQKKREELQSQLDGLIDMRTRNLLDDEEYSYQRDRIKLEREKVDELLRHTEKRADDWLELTERAFDFATYARVHFKTGDLAVKRDILRTMGENLVLKDGQLSITPNEWLIPIGNEYPAIEKAHLWARTNKKAASKEIETTLMQNNAIWRARWDLNPRHPA